MLETQRSRRKEVWHRTKGYLAVAVSLSILVGGGFVAYQAVESRVTGFFTEAIAADYDGPGVDDIEVEVVAGSSVTDIGEMLYDQDVIASSEAWQAAAAGNDAASSIQAGFYALKTQIPAAEALEVLVDPANRVVTRVTVPEGLRLSEQVTALTESGIPAEDFEAALSDPDELDLVDFADGDPEGFLFPDTYEYREGETTATDLLRQMAERYARESEDIDLVGGAEELDYSPREVAIVASILSEEVSNPDDAPRVARVLYNRLEQGMRLQLDSTVYYASDSTPDTIPPGAFEDDNPYNTYTNDGLPPGPIAAPGRVSLDAAANPADGDWLFFVTVNFDTGETKFADTLEEHNRNVAEWEQWCDDNDNPSGCR